MVADTETPKPAEHRVEVVTRRNAAQVKVLNALGVDTSTWDKASIA